MIAFIDDHRQAYGVEPICKVLPIAPSTYHAHAARRADPGKLPARARSDVALMAAIRRVHEANFHVYGVRKVWRQLGREGLVVARCRVARLMRSMGLQGVVRGRKVRTTIPDPAAACPLDHVNRQFRAPRPNALWVSDFTYVATWSGFVYVAFVIDAFARRIVGWRVSRTAHASFVLDALEQALHQRRPVRDDGLVHHSDRGAQYLALRYTDRLAEAGVQPSVGSVGDSYDNALAETINGLFKAEVIHRRGPWRSMEAVEFATLEWVDWFNNRRLLEPIGNIPPAEAETRYYAQIEAQALAAQPNPNSLRETRGGSGPRFFSLWLRSPAARPTRLARRVRRSARLVPAKRRTLARRACSKSMRERCVPLGGEFCRRATCSVLSNSTIRARRRSLPKRRCCSGAWRRK